MRAFAVGLATLLFTSLAHAEGSTSPGAERTTGLGFAATGVVLTGFGGYFAYRGWTRDDEVTSGRLGIALLAGGLITTGAGAVIFMTSSTEPGKPEKPKQALVLGPTGASWVASF
jgi:hypothetical protein